MMELATEDKRMSVLVKVWFDRAVPKEAAVPTSEGFWLGVARGDGRKETPPASSR